MRTLMLACLLATAATPALAGPREDREAARSERRAERAERSESRSERSQAVERPRFERSERPEVRFERAERPQVMQSDRGQAGQRVEDQRARWGDQRARWGEARGETAPRRDANDGVRNWRADERRAARDLDGVAAPVRERLSRSREDVRQRPFGRPGRPEVSPVPREGTQPPLRAENRGSSPSRYWRGDWRNDRRYDWRRHRDRNRSIFHIGFYYDPFGWNYRRYDIGWRMWPSYYSRNYWLQDPWMYRLPPAYPGTQWIRYHYDAILVDTWTGEVVDVIYDFFW